MDYINIMYKSVDQADVDDMFERAAIPTADSELFLSFDQDINVGDFGSRTVILDTSNLSYVTKSQSLWTPTVPAETVLDVEKSTDGGSVWTPMQSGDELVESAVWGYGGDN